ncbi:unnamed protein product [Heligmosomoides polygyrus]|uniref:C3H1-type domain-containing protein n=1 Tax=Heligmosomoides polygyrus TaxID=6339 RepID=A0A3P8G7G6_HELPZ|nr:unnamed protein product [Heligmosomoides polygyrus]
MVDLMATTADYDEEPKDYEDGELPEDGEICDDDEEPKRGEKVGDVFGYGAEDKDYRFEEEPSGDFDYRQGGGGHVGRRRRHSPQHEDEWESRGPKRPYGGRGFRGFRPKPRWATEHQICKFFREGYCRDGDNCAYSHQAEDSLRRPELCKFYQQGFCKKGLTCLLLHGEFPCKAYHKGECSRDPCHFSHVPLTDYTRPLFERMCQEDEMYANRGLGNHLAPMKRRVLLPQGPGGAPQTTQQPSTTSAPSIHASIPQQPINGGPLAPPAVVVPTLSAAVGPTPPPPPLSSGAGDGAMVRQIPEGNVVAWRLLKVDAPPAYSGINPGLSVTSQDPRMNRVISSQFDAVSSLIAATPQPSTDSSSVSRPDLRFRPEDRRPSDDRPRASSWMPQMA